MEKLELKAPSAPKTLDEKIKDAAQYCINKSALVAEIKERIETYNKGYANGDDARADALEVLLHVIDTLDVKYIPQGNDTELSEVRRIITNTN